MVNKNPSRAPSHFSSNKKHCFSLRWSRMTIAKFHSCRNRWRIADDNVPRACTACPTHGARLMKSIGSYCSWNQFARTNWFTWLRMFRRSSWIYLHMHRNTHVVFVLLFCLVWWVLVGLLIFNRCQSCVECSLCFAVQLQLTYYNYHLCPQWLRIRAQTELITSIFVFIPWHTRKPHIVPIAHMMSHARR